MDFLDRMNEAMDYIETKLDEELDLEELAHVAGSSLYHLSRIFPFITGQSLSSYIRRRRLSQAALELRGTKQGLLDIAIKYGYSSVDAFSRAFREVHGVSPRGALDEAVPIRSYSKMAFKISITGVNAMVYRLVEKESFRIIGIMKTVPLVFTGPNKDIDEMWRSLRPGDIKAWKAMPPTEPSGIISASVNFSQERMAGSGTLDHYIGVATTSHEHQAEACLEVAAGTWAVFEVRGDFPVNLQNVWGRIYSEWFPVSPYQLREGPEILWNEGPDTSKVDFKSEIWIPVQLK